MTKAMRNIAALPFEVIAVCISITVWSGFWIIDQVAALRR
jgi:hypothetical protein